MKYYNYMRKFREAKIEKGKFRLTALHILELRTDNELDQYDHELNLE